MAMAAATGMIPRACSASRVASPEGKRAIPHEGPQLGPSFHARKTARPSPAAGCILGRDLRRARAVVGRALTYGQPIRPDSVPLLDRQAVLLEKRADARRIHAYDLLEDGHQHAQRVVTNDGASCDLRDQLGFGRGDGEAVAPVDVQHHVDVGTAVPDIDDPVRAHLQRRLQLVQDRHLAVSRRDSRDRPDLARRTVVFEPRAVYVVGRDDALESRLNDLLGGGGDHVEGEAGALDPLLQQAAEEREVVLQADAFPRLDEGLPPYAGSTPPGGGNAPPPGPPYPTEGDKPEAPPPAKLVG